MTALGLALLLNFAVLPGTADAQEKPALSPTRLEFDATRAPKGCNDETRFLDLIANWVRNKTLTKDSERRLVVQIRRSPTGGKVADVKLVDAGGTTMGEHHQTYSARAECHQVLYETAYDAATLLGAFEPPPPAKPCPTCPPPVPPNEPTPCPTCPAFPILSPPIRFVPPLPTFRRSFVGAGVSVYSGLTSEPAFGPRVKLGFVPSMHWPWMHVELDGAWTRQMVPPAKSVSVDAIPVGASLCLSRNVLRFCGGMTTTFFSTQPGDDIRRTVAALAAIAAEFTITGPLSVRIDVFANLRLAEQSIGALWNGIREKDIVTSGGALAAVWSWL